jgi:hypothetical protein
MWVLLIVAAGITLVAARYGAGQATVSFPRPTAQTELLAARARRAEAAQITAAARQTLATRPVE